MNAVTPIEVPESVEKKSAVYLCEGCGIGEAISLDTVETLVTGDLKVPHCKRNAAWCSKEGVAAIKADIDSGDVNQAIIAACSPRVMTDRFSFEGTQVIRANLREQVAWMQKPGNEDTDMLASDNLRMAVAQAGNLDLPTAHRDASISGKLLVVGGGITGLTAAIEAANTGVEVILVEKSDALGGWTAKWSKVLPERPPYRDPQDNNIGELIKAVEDNAAITVHTGTIVTSTSGGPGEFGVDLSGGESINIGAIVVATGWRPYDPAQMEGMGYGSSPDILSDIEFEDLLASGDLSRKSDGKQIENVAFVITGDEARMPYSSGISDRVAIKQALQVTDANPDAMVYVMAEHLRAHGTAEDLYRHAQESGVVFQNGVVKSVTADLTVTLEDRLVGEEIPLGGFDIVVLSTGMVPNSTNIDIEAAEGGAEQLIDDVNPKVPFSLVALAETGAEGEDIAKAETEDAAEDAPAMPAMSGGPILNLQYRQGPHLPVLADGFADSHFICFPYETRRTGIYTCGPVRRAMTIAEARQDAQGAVLKAIQAMRAADHAVAVHPRAGDLSYPEFGLDICTKCRRCTVECPFGAIDELEDGYPSLNPTRCRRCGTCMGACPVRTISFKNYNVPMVANMIQAVDIPDEFSGKPRILVLACENDAYPALDMAGLNRRELSPYLRIIPVRCLGSVSASWVSNALERGYDGVMLMGCKSGDDYQCHFVKGSALAQERMASVSATLESMMLETERVKTEDVSIGDSCRVTTLLNDFSEEIVTIGFNPFKGF